MITEFIAPKTVQEAIERITELRAYLQNLKDTNKEEFNNQKMSVMNLIRKYLEWIDKIINDRELGCYWSYRITKERILYNVMYRAYIKGEI